MNPARHLIALADPAAPIGDDCAVVPIAELVPVKGETVAQFLTRAQWDLDLMPSAVCVSRHLRAKTKVIYYGRAEWATTKIRANDNLVVLSRPAGGGGGGGGQGKAIGAAVAMIALSVLAPFAAPALGLAAGSIGATLLTTAIIAGGSLLLSHFLQPKAATPSDKSPDLYSFAFQGNQARPQQVVPVGYGTRLVFPDFGAPTYSEYDGDAMIDYGLYCVGCGRYQLEELRLSDTPIWTRAAGFLAGFGGLELQHAEPGEDITLFPVNVTTSTEVAGIQLEANIVDNGEADAMVGPFAANAAGTEAVEIVCDFIFPSGLYYQKGTQTLAAGVQVNVWIWPIDAAGAQTGAPTLHAEVFQAAKNNQLRFTKRYAVAPGRYSVGVQRLNGKPTNGAVDNVVWSALRAHINGPQAFDGVTMLALKAKADNGLQTLAGGKVGVVATRILPVYSGDTWTEAPTRSIAWAAFDVWTNEDYSAALPASGVDLETLLAYDAFWAEAGHTFDHSFTASSSIIEALETVLKAGRAVPAMMGDTLSIMRDEDRGLPAMLFTDREIVRGSLSVDYTLYNSALADGVVGSYLDETTWRVSEVSSAPDGTVLANPARVELTGVTKRAQAAGLVRFQAGESTYRRTSVSFQVEAEGRLLRRGMAIAVQSELPQVWGESGEILAVSGYSLTLDHALPWSGGGFLEIRAANGTYWGPVAVSQGGAPDVALVDAGDAASVQAATGLSLGQALTRAADQDRPSFVWGTAERRALRCLVKEGAPSGKYLTVTAVNDDPRVYDVSETGVDPLGGPASFLTDKDPPIVTQLVGKMIQEGVAAKLTGGWKAATNALTYEARISFDSAATWTNVYTGTHTSFSVVVNPADLLLQVRGISPKGVAGAWSQVSVTGIVIKIDGDNTDLNVDFEDIVGRAKKLMEQISGLGQSSIEALRKKVFTLNEQIANAAATTAAHEYAQRNLQKVALEGKVTQAFAAIQTEAATRISDNEAFASLTTTIAARLGNAEAQITQEAQTRATSDQATAAQIVTVQARLTAAESGISGQAIALQNLSGTVTSQGGLISSLSTSYTGLDNRLTSAQGTITTQATAINQLTSTVTQQGDTLTAQATSLQALGTTLNGHTSTLTTYGTSIGGLQVQYGVVGTIDGATGGFILQGIKKNDGSVTYQVVFSADVLIDGTLSARKVVDLSLGSNKLAPGALTAGIGFQTGAGSASTSVAVGAGGSVVLICQMTQVAFFPPNSAGTITGYVNGSPVVSSPLSRVWNGDATQFWPQCFVGVWQSPYNFDTVVSVGTTVDPAFGCSVTALGFKR